MSDIGGEQNTGIIKVTVEADGKQSKGFIDIAKTLENMGVWVPKVAEQIEKLFFTT